MLPSVLFSLQLIKCNQKCTHTSTKGTKGLIVFVEYSFSHVPLPYNKFHVSLKGCSQIIEIGTFINGYRFEVGAKIGVLLNCGQQSQFSKVRREFDAGRVNLDPPMTCADWPVPGNLTLLHTQTAYTRKPLHRCCHAL